MDTIGAIGVARYLVFHSAKGGGIGEIAEFALGNLPRRYESMELDASGKAAREGYEYTLDYFGKLKRRLLSR